MRRTNLALAAAISVAALGSGCASTGTTAASAPAPSVAAASPAAATATTVSASPSTAPTASGQTLPDGYDGTRDAQADIQAALASAAKDHREVLLDFGANWCPDCKALDKMFRASQVQPLLQKNYLVVAVDVGRFDHNVDLAGRYLNLQTSGIPALVVLQADGTVRTATDDGSFSNARTMGPDQVGAFLTHWAPGGAQ